MSQNRRQFLQQTTGIAAAGLAAPYLFTSAYAAQESKNDRHTIGCIGTGDRWKQIINGTKPFGDVVAVCDVDRGHVEEGNRIAAGGKAEMFEDYRKVLDNPKIDVVTVVTPDHWHSKIAIEAMQAGKHVYCEKPLTLTIDEGKQICKVQKATGKTFQVGTQQRSEMSGVDGTGKRYPHQFLQAVGLAHDGRLGKIRRVECYIGGAPTSGELPKIPVPDGLNWDLWLGQAPKVDFIGNLPADGKGFGQSRCHYEFRWWYEYSGGKLTDWGAHHVDIATWLIGMDHSGPTTVKPVMVKHPVEFKNGYPTVNNKYNTAAEFEVQCIYPNDVELIIRHEPAPGTNRPEGNGIWVEGEKGTLFVSRSKLMGPAAEGLKENPLSAELLMKLNKGKKPGANMAGTNPHMYNFFDCLRNGGMPTSDVHTHHRSMTTCHLANIAMRLNRPLKWDPVAEEIVGDSEANGWQKREQRKGFEIKA